MSVFWHFGLCWKLNLQKMTAAVGKVSGWPPRLVAGMLYLPSAHFSLVWCLLWVTPFKNSSVGQPQSSYWAIPDHFSMSELATIDGSLPILFRPENTFPFFSQSCENLILQCQLRWLFPGLGGQALQSDPYTFYLVQPSISWTLISLSVTMGE